MRRVALCVITALLAIFLHWFEPNICVVAYEATGPTVFRKLGGYERFLARRESNNEKILITPHVSSYVFDGAVIHEKIVEAVTSCAPR